VTGEERDSVRRLLVAGNWKMNCTIPEAVQLASSLREGLGTVVDVEVAVCPPFVALQSVAQVLKDTGVQLGAQDAFYEDAGAYTGAVSPRMLAGLCRYVIVGHSERRKWFGESDESVAKKVAALRRHGLTPILCVGETLEQFDAGETASILQRQIRGALEFSPPLEDIVVAYEPVWAIGTGRSADPEAVNATVAGIREVLGRIWDAAVAAGVRILYGGSVTIDNIAAYIRQSEIDGTLVGGASLRATEFCEMVFRAASTR